MSREIYGYEYAVTLDDGAMMADGTGRLSIFSGREQALAYKETLYGHIPTKVIRIKVQRMYRRKPERGSK